jgi:hypothetical protein
MTHEELIAKAREHAKAFGRDGVLPTSFEEFSRITSREALVVCFGSHTRADFIEVYLDKESGDFITALYNPQSEAGGR